MKISKYSHSCLLIEDMGKTVLIDPGSYSTIDVDALQNFDYLLITHEHMDHMHIPLIKKLLGKFPNTEVFSNPSISEILRKENILVNTGGNEFISFEEAKHEKIFMGPSPMNYSYTVFNKLTHPGDSLSFTKSADILALPITAPWGDTTWAVEKALEIKPKVVIPIHDFQWKDEVRRGMYQRLTEYFKQKGIEFIGLESEEIREV